MSQLPSCSKCGSEYTYEDGNLCICPECAHEWVLGEEDTNEDTSLVKDAHGNILQSGDSVSVIKELKVKGGSPVKAGTKVKNIRLVDGADKHNIDCRIPGHGAMLLKSEFVKKV